MTRSSRDGLRDVKRAWEQLGRQDPLYGVLSYKRFRGNRWDPEEFFRTGQEYIGSVFDYLEQVDVQPAKRTALDFGCGVGRLSQPLADRFDEVVAVDISSTMLDTAKRLNKKGDRIRFLLNQTDALEGVAGGSIDFVFSALTLQHVPTAQQASYIAEFMRVLRPGGVAVFHALNALHFGPYSLRGRLVQLRRIVQSALRRVVGRPPVEIHRIARSSVEKIIADQGCELRDVFDAASKTPGHDFRYCVVKPA